MGNSDSSKSKETTTLIITKYGSESSFTCWNTPGFVTRLQQLSYLDVFKIKGRLDEHFKIQNSSGDTIFLARSTTLGEDSFDLDDLDGKRVLSVRKADSESSDIYREESRLAPGMLVGKIEYEKDLKGYNLKFSIVSASGDRLSTRRSGRTYEMVREDDGRSFAGSFKRVSGRGVKGHFPKNLDLLLKAAILSAAVVICIRQYDGVD